MTSKQFNQKINKLVKKYDFIETEKNQYIIKNTAFGDLYLFSDPSPRNEFYSVFMRFIQPEKMNLSEFNHCLDNSINNYSLKWNLHNKDAHYIVVEVLNRLSNLHWLKNPENKKLVLNS